jgi:YidC/Oxa1 family membrane protein insertase
MFTFMMAPFSAGLVIYWAWSNILSIGQQYYIMRKHGTPIGKAPPAPVPVAAGGGDGKKGGSGKGSSKKG